MSLSLDDVRRIAHLARLDLPDAQATVMQAQLNHFFDELVQPMRAVATGNAQPLATPLAAWQPVPLRLRDDAVTEQPGEAGRADVLANAPAHDGGMFLVPRVIE